MDYINILRFERWRKLNDRMIDRNSFDTSTLDNRVVASLKSVINKDGFLKQKIVGAKPISPTKLIIFTAD